MNPKTSNQSDVQKPEIRNTSVGDNTGNTFVWHGDAITGSDGNVYLLRSTSPALIYVITPKGEVARKLRIASDNPGLIARTMRPGSGKIVISFLEPYRSVGTTKVIDLRGNVIGGYVSSDDSIQLGLPGCYRSDGFTFISQDSEHNLYLSKAK